MLTTATSIVPMGVTGHSISTPNDGYYTTPPRFTGVAAWPAANKAIYVPVRVPSRCLVRKLWYGAYTGNAGNIDIGIYDAAGTRLVSSGSTAKVASGSGTEAVIDTTDTTIGPGLHYMALACSNNTDSFIVKTSAVAPLPAAMGVLTEALGSVTLPATATWVQDYSNTTVPDMGMFMVTTIS